MPNGFTPKRSGWWGAALIIVSCLIAAYVTRLPVEPEWKGKTLSQWLDTPDFIGFYEYRVAETKANEEPIAAIRAMGTNCLPWLLARMTADYQPGILRGWLDDLARKIEVLAGYAPWETYSRFQTRRQTQAIAAISVLGEVSAPVAPELQRGLLTPTHQLDQLACASALGVMGDTGISVLLSAVTNTDAKVRQFAVSGLGCSSTRHGEALAALLRAAQDSEKRVRQFVALSLVEFTNHSHVVVPALTNLMADPDQIVRFSAVSSLDMYAGDRTTAITALERLMSDADPKVSDRARNTLDRIRSQVPP